MNSNVVHYNLYPTLRIQQEQSNEHLKQDTKTLHISHHYFTFTGKKFLIFSNN